MCGFGYPLGTRVERIPYRTLSQSAFSTIPLRSDWTEALRDLLPEAQREPVIERMQPLKMPPRGVEPVMVRDRVQGVCATHRCMYDD